MISYYDLIELIGKHEEPKYVYYHFPSRKVKYEAIYDGNTFSYYSMCKNEEEHFEAHSYMLENLLESEFFDKRIEIIRDDEILKKMSELQSQIDKLSNEVSKYYSKIKGASDRARYLKGELSKAINEWQRN